MQWPLLLMVPMCTPIQFTEVCPVTPTSPNFGTCHSGICCTAPTAGGSRTSCWNLRTAVALESNLTTVGSGSYCFGVTLECGPARFHGKYTCRIIPKSLNTTHSKGYPLLNQLDALTNLMTHRYFFKSLENGIASSCKKGDLARYCWLSSSTCARFALR